MIKSHAFLLDSFTVIYGTFFCTNFRSAMEYASAKNTIWENFAFYLVKICILSGENLAKFSKEMVLEVHLLMVLFCIYEFSEQHQHQSTKKKYIQCQICKCLTLRLKNELYVYW